MKVLIVEDERITRDQLSMLLKEWGYEVLTADDGNEAWKILQTEGIRLLITDLLMPGVDGIELCKRIRGMKRLHYTYVLVLTGMSDQKSLFDAMFAGADDFVVKPWHNNEIRARLRTGERIIHLEDELKDRIKKLEEANQIIRGANERMMKEVAFMSRMQSTMLPSEHSAMKGLKHAWKHQPFSMHAGDGMNLFRLDENNFAITMADVSGSGDAASFLLSSLARKMVPIPGQPGILKVLSRQMPGYEIISPEKVLNLLNQEFPLDLESGKSFSVLYGIINIVDGTFVYSAAGSAAPLLVRCSGKVVRCDSGNEPVGLFKGKSFDLYRLQLEPGDRLVFYSNGLGNLKDPSGETFAGRRMLELLRQKYSNRLEDFVEELFRASVDWGKDNQSDLSVLAVEFSGEKNNGTS